MDNQNVAIEQILARNARVEAEKAWERSLTRRGFIALLTYLTAVSLLWMLGQSQIFAAALIPACGYILSTLSLPGIKRMWIQKTSH